MYTLSDMHLFEGVKSKNLDYIFKSDAKITYQITNFIEREKNNAFKFCNSPKPGTREKLVKIERDSGREIIKK